MFAVVPIPLIDIDASNKTDGDINDNNFTAIALIAVGKQRKLGFSSSGY